MQNKLKYNLFTTMWIQPYFPNLIEYQYVEREKFKDF